MSYLLDTDWIISFLNGRPDAVDLVDAIAADGDSVSAITCGEIFEGLLSVPNAAQRSAEFERFLRSVDVRGLDVEVARRYAVIRHRLRALGQGIPDNDAWIAATALAHDLILASRDSHFSRVSDLKRHESSS